MGPAMPNKASGQSILKRINERLNELGISERAAGVQANDSPDLIRSIRRNLESGRQRGISTETLQALAPVLGVTLEWLTTGRNYHLLTQEGRNSDQGGTDFPPFNAVSTLRPYRPRLPGASPIIDVVAGCGPGGIALLDLVDGGGVEYAGDAVRGEIYVPSDILRTFSITDPGRLHWMKIRGDSMHRDDSPVTLEDGDIAGIDTTDRSIGQGGVFAFRDPDGEVQIKRLHKLMNTEPPRIEVISDNQRQGNDTIPASLLFVIGRVVARLTHV